MSEDSGVHLEVASGRLRCLALTSAAHFVNDGTVFFVPLIAAVLAKRPGVSPLDLTAMFVAFYSTSAVLSIYVGSRADRTGRPGTLIGTGLALLSLGLLGFYIAATYSEGPILVVGIIGSAVLTGFGSAFYHPLGAAIIEASFGEKAQGRALGVNGAVGSLGRALYPSFFFVVALFITQSESFGFFALVGLMASAILWMGFRPAAMAKAPERTPGGDHQMAQAATKGIAVLTLVAFIRSVASQGIVAWIPIFISTQKGVGVTGSLGLSLTLMYGAAIVGQPIFGLLADRFNKRLILGVGTVGIAASIFGYVSTTGIAEQTFLILFGFFTFSGFPLLMSLVSDYVPRGSFSSGNALVWGLGVTGGAILGPLIVGAILLPDYSNMGFVFGLMAAGALVAAVGTVFLAKTQTKGKMPLFG